MGNGVTASNTASVSQQQIIDSLTAKLAKANERVRELESIQAYSEETGFIDLNKFAIEKKIELLSDMVSSANGYLFYHDKLDIRANHLDMLLKNFCNYHREQLRKEQNQC